MNKPKMVGTVNGYVSTKAKFGTTRFVYDGTTKGLVISAVARGASVGTVIESEFGKYVITSAPHDNRAGGYWADDVWN